MNLLKPLLLSTIAAGAMLGQLAAAQERPPRVGEVRIVPKKPDDAKPAPPAAPKKKKPAKRRSVRQVLDDDVRPGPPPAAFAPGLQVPESRLPVPGAPPGPVILNCVGGTCTDANGGRYNGAVGTTLIGPQGKLCTDNGLAVQCH